MDEKSVEALYIRTSPEALRKLRIEMGLTTREMAIAVGVTPGLWEAWEQGDRVASRDVLKVSSVNVTNAKAAAREKLNIFGQFGLKELRRRLGKTCEQMADELGLKLHHLRSIEVGRRELPLRARNEIVDRYAMLIDDMNKLLGGHERTS